MGDAYADYVEARYQGEVLGEALFAAMADARADEQEVAKLRTLERLERETRELLEPEVARLGRSTAPDPEQLEQGRSIGKALGAAPWNDVLGGMRGELVKLVAEFEAAEALAPAGKVELARHVTAHEQALLDFVDAELDSKSADPLAAVRALLRESSPGTGR